MDTHDKEYIQIGLNIMRYCKEQGLTQEQLAELARLSSESHSASGNGNVEAYRWITA